MSLVEREREFACLAELLADCERGRGAVAFIDGPVGSGKSSLLNSFGDGAADSGALLLRASGFRAERDLPLGVLNQILDAAAFFAGENGSVPRPSLDRGAADHQLWAGVTHELWTICRKAAQRCPLIVAVDDVQHADARSVQFLSFLARRVRSASILLVLAEQNSAYRTRSQLRADCLRLPYSRHLPLAPLSRSGIERLMGERLGVVVPRALAASAYDYSGGNPLLLDGLLAGHRARQRTGNVMGEPAGPGTSSDPGAFSSLGTPIGPGPETVRPVGGDPYHQAVVSVLHRGEPGVLAAARTLAVFGPHTPAKFVGELLGAAGEEAHRALDELGEVGVLREGWFRHPVARAAVLSDMPAAERARLHGRAAEVLYDSGATATLVARQLLEAGGIAFPWAAPVLHEAARHALSDNRTEQAVACLVLARDSLPDGAEHARTTLELAGAVWRIDPARTQRYLDALADALRRGRLRGSQVRQAVGHLLWHGRVREAGDALESLRAGAAAGDGAIERDAVVRWLACSFPPLASRLAPASADSAPEPAGMLARVLAGQAGQETVAEAERVLETLPLDNATLEPLSAALLSLVYADELDRSVHWNAGLLKESTNREAPGWQAWFTALSAEISLRQGNLVAAEEQARAALDRITPWSWGPYVGGPLAGLIIATTAMGRADRAAKALRLPVPDALFESRTGPMYLYARGRHHAAMHRFRAAYEDFTAVGELLAGWRMDAPGFLPWRTDAAAACLGMGDRKRARELVDAQLARPGVGNGRTLGLSLRVLAATRDPRFRPGILGEAVEVLQVSGDRLELARALTDLGDAQHTLRLSASARTTARIAAAMARECRADPLLLRTVPPSAAEPRPGGPALSAVISGPARTSGPTSPPTPGAAGARVFPALSDAERRVAALAAAGDSNREIARKLLITVSTVEQHLTRVYRKLRVAGRAKLPRGLLTTGRGPLEPEFNRDRSGFEAGPGE
ncbi:AAA family ATPase [Streptomyces sp. NPDC055036]